MADWSPGARLIGRARERSALRAALSAAIDGDGTTVVIDGPPGIGKTSLCADLAHAAETAGIRRLHATGNEYEGEFGFGIARSLLERAIHDLEEEDRQPVMAGAAGLAAPLLQGSAEVIDAFAVIHGLYWALANLAERTPVVIEVDDAQWADEPSLRWLLYTARRLEGLPILLVIAVRTTNAIASIEALKDTAALTLSLDSLTLEETIELLHRARCDASPAFAASALEATGGNPFLLLELASAVAEAGWTPDDAAASRALELVPPVIARSVVSRLARLGTSARDLATSVAVLGDGSPLAAAARHAGISNEEAGASADDLAAAGLFAKERPLRFEHAILRTALYADMAPGARATAHSRAAQQYAELDGDVGRAAAHLLHVEPAGSPWVVEVLTRAAQATLQEGDPSAAVTFLERARSERSSADVLSALGQAQMAAGDLAAASTLEEAWRQTTDPSKRAELGLMVGAAHVSTGRFDPGAAVLATALAEADAADPSRGPLAIGFATIGLFSRTYQPQAAAVLEMVAPLMAADTPDNAVGRCFLAFAEACGGGTAQAATDLITSALSEGWVDQDANAEAFHSAAFAAIGAEQFDLVAPAVERGLRGAREQGALAQVGHLLYMRAEINFRRGELALAEADGREALELGLATNLSSLPPAARLMALVLPERGDIDGAYEAVAKADRAAPGMGEYVTRELLLARGIMAHARGNQREAADLLLEYGDNPHPGETAWWRPWRPYATRALLSLGRREDAERVARDGVVEAKAFGAPALYGAALHAHALTLDRDDQVTALTEATTVLEPTAMRLEYARALVSLGAVLRRANRRHQAEATLRAGLDIADTCGARSLAEAALTELHAAGFRPRRSAESGLASLTASERRVAELAALGLTNVEIAQQLFVARSTVQTHLAAVYRKLGVSGRKEIAAQVR